MNVPTMMDNSNSLDDKDAILRELAAERAKNESLRRISTALAQEKAELEEKLKQSPMPSPLSSPKLNRRPRGALSKPRPQSAIIPAPKSSIKRRSRSNIEQSEVAEARELVRQERMKQNDLTQSPTRSRLTAKSRTTADPIANLKRSSKRDQVRSRSNIEAADVKAAFAKSRPHPFLDSKKEKDNKLRAKRNTIASPGDNRRPSSLVGTSSTGGLSAAERGRMKLTKYRPREHPILGSPKTSQKDSRKLPVAPKNNPKKLVTSTAPHTPTRTQSDTVRRTSSLPDNECLSPPTSLPLSPTTDVENAFAYLSTTTTTTTETDVPQQSQSEDTEAWEGTFDEDGDENVKDNQELTESDNDANISQTITSNTGANVWEGTFDDDDDDEGDNNEIGDYSEPNYDNDEKEGQQEFDDDEFDEDEVVPRGRSTTYVSRDRSVTYVAKQRPSNTEIDMGEEFDEDDEIDDVINDVEPRGRSTTYVSRDRSSTYVKPTNLKPKEETPDEIRAQIEELRRSAEEKRAKAAAILARSKSRS
eukprot:m.69381 g.69381  ORF g.69381 m.69381 type:complete len:531 (+) comp12051_c0_seq1:141-1733(+)